MSIYPLIRKNGIEISFSTVRQDDHAIRALRDQMFDRIDRHDDRPGRTACENSFFLRQPPTTNYALEVGYVNALVRKIGLVKFGPHRRAMSWDQSLGRLTAEDHA